MSEVGKPAAEVEKPARRGTSVYGIMSLVAGILGLAAAGWTFTTLKSVSALTIVPNVLLVLFYIGGVVVGVLERRVDISPRIARLVRGLTAIDGIGALLVWVLSAMLDLVPDYHVIPALTLLMALISRPRTGYEPLL